MTAQKRTTKPKSTNKIASPETVLAAAKKAPRVFNIGAYYRAIWTMREKGHSWRDIADWLQQFSIEVSFVHLRRLYVQEHARLVKLSAEERRKLGFDDDMIAAGDERSDADPTKRMLAPDPDPEREPSEKENEE